MQTKITTIDRFDGTSLVPRGGIVRFADDIDLSGDHTLVDVPTDYAPETVELAPIAPTGTNTAAGAPLASEADLAKLMDTTHNDDDALVAGTVAEVTKDLGGKTDEELSALRAAEIDREQPRKGVIKAIDAELTARKG